MPGEVRQDAHLAMEAAKLGALFEDRSIGQIDKLDRDIQEKVACVEMINSLKAAMMRASNNGKQEINFNEDNELREALDQFLAAFPEGANFVPDDGILHQDQLAEGLRYLDGRMREPMTFTEFLLHKLSRTMADVQVAIDALRDILENANRSAHFIIRNGNQ